MHAGGAWGSLGSPLEALNKEHTKAEHFEVTTSEISWLLSWEKDLAAGAALDSQLQDPAPSELVSAGV